MRPVGAAVVGTGFIGPVHVEALRRLGHRVVGILGSSPDKSRAAADRLGLEEGYPDLAAVLADRRVEVVHLASPNAAHFEQCKQALAAGRHVVCEKPLAMTAAETAELARLAAASPLVTAVNYNVRFYPLVLDARERVRRGEVGEVFHVTGSYLQDWLHEPTDFNWRVLPEHGGELRAVADIGTHWLDTVGFVTGLEVTSVCADLRTVHPVRHRPAGGSETFTGSAGGTRATVPTPVATEDYGSLLFRLSNGAAGCVTVSQVTAGRKNCIRFDLAGSKEALWWDSEEPNTLHVGRRTGVEAVPRGMGAYSDYPPGHAEGFPDTFKMLYRAVYADVIAGTKSPEPLYATFADGHREVVLCEAVLRSHRERRWVDVDPSRT
jgi:predicted dehydrogenase